MTIRDGGNRGSGYVLIVDGKDMYFETQDAAWEWWNEQDGLGLSVHIARSVGVPEDKILHNMEEINSFFMCGKNEDSGE